MFFCTLSILALGLTLGIWRGDPLNGVIAWLTASIVFLIVAVCARPEPEAEARVRKALPVLFAGVIGMFAAGQLFLAPSIFTSRLSLSLLSIGVFLLYAVRRGIPSLKECRRRILPAVMLGFLLLGIKMIRDNPKPGIDVFVLQQTAANAMIHFQNPYTASIPDIYGPGSLFYIPLTRNGRSLYGLTYPPLIGFFDASAFLLTGDIRYGMLLAMLLSAGLIAMMQPSWPALCGSVLLLINPFSLAMIVNAWIEPVLLLTFCLTLFAASRYPKAVPYLFGLFLCAKQTNLLVLPLGWILADDTQRWKGPVSFLAKSIGVVVAVNLPFYLWNPGAFILSLITIQFSVPLRVDLISFPAYAAEKGWFVVPIWCSFLYLPIGWYLGFAKAPRFALGFAAASAITLIPFFALSKQGAPNYYFFGIGMMCCVLALSGSTVHGPAASASLHTAVE